MRFPRLLIVLLALLLGAGAGELILRLLLPPPRYVLSGDPANRLPGLLVPHPRRGYALAPGFVGEIERDGRRVRVAVNSQGLRGEELPPRGASPLLLAAGDSFTVGFGVAAEEAWPERLAAHLGRAHDPAPRVANAGVSGYSLRQVRLTVEDLVPRLHPDLVVVGVYPDAVWRIDNPYVLHDGLLINTSTLPRLDRNGDDFVYSPYETPWLRRLHHWSGRNFMLAYHLLRLPPAIAHRVERTRASPETRQQTARRLAPLLDELDRLDTSLEAAGTAWTALLVNPQAEAGGFDEEQGRLNDVVAAHLRARGVAVVDPLPELRRAAGTGAHLRLPHDHHWSAQAHDLAAKVAAESLVESRLWPPREP